MKAKACAIFLMLGLVAVCSHGEVRAQTGQFLDEFGASPKSIAMGQAFTALADDFSAAYYNPAGLTQIQSPLEMTIGYYYAKPKAKAVIDVPYRYDNDMPSDITGERSSHGAIIGVASNLDIHSLIQAYPFFRRFAFGMVFWLNLPEMLTYDTGPEPYRPHYFRYDEGFALLSMVGSAAVEIMPWLSVGAGAFFSQKSYSRQEVYSAVNYSNYFPGAKPDEVIGSRLSIWSRAEAFVVPVVGFLLKPPVRSLQDKIALGVSWRAKNKSHHARGLLIANIGIENPDVPGEPTDIGWRNFIHTYISSIIGYQPAQVTVALAWKPLKGLTLSADVTWKDYSKYVVYSDQKPKPPFKDTFVPRFGVEYGFEPGFSNPWVRWIERMEVRGGYYFEGTPVKDIDGPCNVFDTDQDVVSTGLQIDFRSRQGRLCHSLAAYFQMHLLRDRHIENDKDPYFGPTDLSGEVWHVGGTFTTRF